MGGFGIGVADGRFAAAIAARQAAAAGVEAPVIVPQGVEATAGFLAPLPVQLLATVAGLDDDFVQLLQRLGVHQLGQLAALSAADVLARFGRQGEFAHRLLAAATIGLPTRSNRPVDWSRCRCSTTRLTTSTRWCSSPGSWPTNCAVR